MDNNLYYFRQWSTEALYDALLGEMKAYLNQHSAYTEGDFRAFLSCYRKSIDLYKLCNDVYPTEDFIPFEDQKTQMEEAIYDLNSCKQLFSEAEYIDIPITFYDFRADGLLMEAYSSFSSAYSMSFNTGAVKDSEGNVVKEFQGKVVAGENSKDENNENLNDYQKSITNLIEPELVDGKIVYQDWTIEYIANALHQAKIQGAEPTDNLKGENGQELTDENGNKLPDNDRRYIALYRTLQKDHNSVFTQKFDALTENDLGTWKDTLAKVEGGKKGGELLWSEVSTYFDLAYYTLHYLWQEVPQTEGHVLETVNTQGYENKELYYNMAVSGIDTLRMYKNTEGDYAFWSSYGYGRAGTYLYNNGTTKKRWTNAPYFNPLFEEGFSHKDYFGSRSNGNLGTDDGFLGTEKNASTYRNNANFSFSMRAHGSFVYYEESDLKFCFIGDDDVYFFLNDTLICDVGGVHGSPQETVYINDFKDSLNLKDGDICTFDMFFADRHISGINLMLKTNIQVMNEDVLTTLGQYGEIVNGRNQVDEYGVGAKLSNNALVDVGAQTAYSFDLLNKGDEPVHRIMFQNTGLGVTLSRDEITLGTAEKNGMDTDLSDLILFYRSCVGTEVNTDAPVDITYEELCDMIGKSNEMTSTWDELTYGTFPTGSYRLTHLTEDQLMNLLLLGVPRNCQLSIYGFKRITTAEDYPNLKIPLTSRCYNALNGGAALRGEASLYIQVPDVNISLPTADPEEVVIDYGKAVEISLQELHNHLYDNTEAVVGDFVGLTASGEYNNQFLSEAPEDLSTSTVAGKDGIFTLKTDSIVYKPKNFLSSVDRAYAVYELMGCYGTTAGGNAVEYKYILLEIEIIPASVMYYEAEDFADKGSYYDGGDTMCIDPYNIPVGAFFADFDGTGYDRRYEADPIYAGVDFDTKAGWSTWNQTENSRMGEITFDRNAGTISTSIHLSSTGEPQEGSIYLQSSGDIEHNFPLSYKPFKQNYVQLRFKLENFQASGTPMFNLVYYYTKDKNGTDADGNASSDTGARWEQFELPEVAWGGDFVTLCYELPNLPKGEIVTAFRPVFVGLESLSATQLGKLTLDYLYVGEKLDPVPDSPINTVKQTSDTMNGTTAQSRQDWGEEADNSTLLAIEPDNLPEGAFYVDFDGTGYEDRYKEDPVYGGCDFDDMNYWVALGQEENQSNNKVQTKVSSQKDVGELTFKVPSHVDGYGNYGPYIGTTRLGTERIAGVYPAYPDNADRLAYLHENAYCYFPLHYVPESKTYIQIRFKVEGCEWVGSQRWIELLYNYNKDGVSKYNLKQQQYIKPGYAVEENGIYQTVCYEIPDGHAFYTADWIEYFAFRFKGLKGANNTSGTITLDYIYIGPWQEEQQDFDRASDTFYDMEIDKEHIPYDAFFVDFDGEGYGSRYRDNAQYGGYDFDTEEAWYSHKENSANQSYNDHTLNTTTGTMELSNITAKDEKGNSLGAWIQTIIPGQTLGTTPLRLNAGKGHIAQIRFRVENCSKYASDGNISLFFSSTADIEDTDKNVARDDRRARFALSNKEVLSGDYITVRFSLDNTYYASSQTIDIMRLYIAGYKDNPDDDKTGKIIIDYIYVGPELGLPEDVNREYLFFDFENDAEAQLRYSSSIYKNTNFDLVTNSNATNWISGSTAKTTTPMIIDGKMIYSDAQLTASTNSSDNNLWVYSKDLSYKGAKDDQFVIRMKIDRANSDQPVASTESNGKIGFRFDYKMAQKNSSNAYETYSSETIYFLPGDYVDTGYFVLKGNMRFKGPNGSDWNKITQIRPVLTCSNGAKLTIDFIYIGSPEGAYDLVSEVERQQSLRGMYFTFDGELTDRIRYEGSTYSGNDYDLQEKWGAYSRAKELKVENGKLSLKDDDPIIYTGSDAANNNLYCYSVVGLQYVPRKDDYAIVRLRIDGDNLVSTYSDGKSAFRLDYKDEKGALHATTAYTFVLEEHKNKGFFTIPIPMNNSRKEYNAITALTQLRPVLTGTNGATLTIDYIFIGQPEEISTFLSDNALRDDYLYFGFNESDSDKIRYSSSAYGSINYDSTDLWRPESIQDGVASYKDTVSNTFSYLAMREKKLRYVIGEEDYCQIRFKIEGSAQDMTPEDGQVSLALMFTTENKTEPSPPSAGYTYFKLEDYLEKGFMTLTFRLGNNDPAYAPGQVLTSCYPQFGTGLDGGTYTIDYIYVGPLTEANPAQESLFFDFDSTGADRDRYGSHTYGYANYDDPKVINWNGSDTTEANSDVDEITISNGHAHMNIYPDEGAWYAMYAGLVYNNRATYLDYVPAPGDLMQMRFKMEGIKATANSGKGSAILYYYVDGNASFKLSDGTYVEQKATFDITEDGYVTVTAPMEKANYIDATRITGLTVAFQYINAVDDTMPGKISVDYVYLGPGEKAPDPVYGHDSSYDNDTLLSDNKSLFVEGNGIRNAEGTDTEYTESTFTFKGTGFDIISRTGKKQATIRVEVKNRATGKIEKTLTVNNKGELELYQIPVVSVQGLPYGEYTVALWVNKAVNAPLDFLSRGGEFYLDAIRIYDPIDVDGTDLTDPQQSALNAYEGHKEAHNYVKEIRNILLSAEDFYALTNATEGAVFVDVSSPTVDPFPSEETEEETLYTQPTIPPSISTDGYYTASVSTYNKIGPKNEVYLAPGQAIAFMLQVNSARKPLSIDIGAKTIQGDPVTLAAGFVTMESGKEKEVAKLVTQISSSTAQYFALDESVIPSEKDVYLVVYNASTATTDTGRVLSITDLKIAYDADPNSPSYGDQLADPEVDPTVSEDPTETGTVTEVEDNTETSSTNKPGSGSGGGSNASGSQIKMQVHGNATDAVKIFVRSIHETPAEPELPEEPWCPPVQEEIRIYHSLNLASDISVNFLVPKADLEGFDMSTVYMECLMEGYYGVTTLHIAPVEKGEYYYFTLTGLTAVQMNDRIHATLYGEKAGQLCYSATDRYSIATYAYSQLNKVGASGSLKTLCADLLRYGAKAQIFKAYRTDALADGNMTEEQKAYLSDTDTVTFGNTNKVLDDVSNAPIAWAGKALSLESKVAVRFVFDPSDYSGDVYGLSLRISYEDAEGNTKTLEVKNPTLYNEAMGCYAFTLDTLLAAELRAVISAQIYAGDTPVSCTLQYSPDTYGNNKTGALLDLCKALFAYSDSAKAYFQ